MEPVSWIGSIFEQSYSHRGRELVQGFVEIVHLCENAENRDDEENVC